MQIPGVIIDVPASVPGSQGVFDGKLKKEDGDCTPLETTKALAEKLAAVAIKYQGHALFAFLRKLIRDKDWATKVSAYKSQFESEVASPNSTALYRIRSHFAIIWAGGALAIDYGVLPWKKSRLRKAVVKCFRRGLRVLQNPKAVQAAGSAHNAPEDPLKSLKERLAQCSLCAITPRTKVLNEELMLRRQADGFIINGLTYVKQDRLKAWFPEKSVRTALRKTGIFQTNRPDTTTVEKKITGIEGKPRYYAIKAKALDRSS